MKLKENRFVKFLNGRGFYLVLAACLVAIGGAAWTAWAGFSSPDVGELSETPSASAPESTETPSFEVQTEKPDQPYSSEDTSSEPVRPPSTTAIHFIYPLSGSEGKGFSGGELVWSETFKDMRTHDGLDIKSEAGAEVFACGNGRVAEIAFDDMLGMTVTVDHGNGVVAKYCGLAEEISVKKGDVVSAGVKLGNLGEIPAECEEGHHLHLEFYRNSVAVDPKSVIEGE